MHSEGRGAPVREPAGADQRLRRHDLSRFGSGDPIAEPIHHADEVRVQTPAMAPTGSDRTDAACRQVESRGNRAGPLPIRRSALLDADLVCGAKGESATRSAQTDPTKGVGGMRHGVCRP